MEDSLDQWGRDPQVRTMRRIFARMETLQADVLQRAGISPFDERLDRWRRTALHQFEQEWSEVSRGGGRFSEDDLAGIYGVCLTRTMAKDGVTVPGEETPGHRS